jgi:chromosome partitioning protein
MTILTVTLQKGGVGKTSLVANLGCTLATQGKRVLLIDCDPQGNLSTHYGYTARHLDRTLYEVLWGVVTPEEAILTHEASGVHLLPANNNLWALGSEMPRAAAQVPAFMDPDRLIQTRLGHLAELYDLILLDTPPSLDFLTRSAFAWATHLLIALQCEYFAVDASIDLLETLALIRQPERGLNPQLKIVGAVPTMFQKNNLSQESLETARYLYGQHGIRVLDAIIPRTVRYGEAPALGLPAVLAFKGAVRHHYDRLAEEVCAHVSA